MRPSVNIKGYLCLARVVFGLLDEQGNRRK